MLLMGAKEAEKRMESAEIGVFARGRNSHAADKVSTESSSLC
jgi:hypothetical protein